MLYLPDVCPTGACGVPVNRHRLHRARNLRPPDHDDGITVPVTDLAVARMRGRKVLGG